MDKTYKVRIKIKRPHAKNIIRTGFYHDNTEKGMTIAEIKADIIKRWQASIDANPQLRGGWVELMEITKSDLGFFLLAKG